jgi:hypothetical protein
VTTATVTFGDGDSANAAARELNAGVPAATDDPGRSGGAVILREVKREPSRIARARLAEATNGWRDVVTDIGICNLQRMRLAKGQRSS